MCYLLGSCPLFLAVCSRSIVKAALPALEHQMMDLTRPAPGAVGVSTHHYTRADGRIRIRTVIGDGALEDPFRLTHVQYLAYAIES